MDYEPGVLPPGAKNPEKRHLDFQISGFSGFYKEYYWQAALRGPKNLRNDTWLAQRPKTLIFLQFNSHFPAKSAKIIVLSSIFGPHGTLNRIFSNPAETQHFRQNRPWVPHAGGQDDGSLHKLPQMIWAELKIDTQDRCSS